MHPFARQLLSWQADNPERRAAALVLEVKGDVCHDIRRMLAELSRADDYVELSLDGRLTWNPLSATWLDAYSLAYTVASLLNQLFGKGKEPFWQQAYTNLVRWIIELYRVLPGGWVTLRDVYHCAIDKALFAKKIQPRIEKTVFEQFEGFKRGRPGWPRAGPRTRRGIPPLGRHQSVTRGRRAEHHWTPVESSGSSADRRPRSGPRTSASGFIPSAKGAIIFRRRGPVGGGNQVKGFDLQVEIDVSPLVDDGKPSDGTPRTIVVMVCGFQAVHVTRADSCRTPERCRAATVPVAWRPRPQPACATRIPRRLRLASRPGAGRVGCVDPVRCSHRIWLARISREWSVSWCTGSPRAGARSSRARSTRQRIGETRGLECRRVSGHADGIEARGRGRLDEARVRAACPCFRSPPSCANALRGPLCLPSSSLHESRRSTGDNRLHETFRT